MSHLPKIPSFVALILLVFGSSIFAEKSELEKGGWDEIPPEEFEAAVPKIDPDAHSEFTFRSIEVDDRDLYSSTHRFHNRVKLFTEAGVKEWDKVDLEYFEGMRVTKVKARVIYPDLTVATLDRKDIVKRKVFENDSFKGYAKSFSFPGLKPGCIIEYSWDLKIDAWFKGVTVDLLGGHPTWLYDVIVKPYKGLAHSVRNFNSGAQWDKFSSGFKCQLTDLKARSNEPYVGPRRDFEPFFVVEYSTKLKALEQQKYWNYRAGRLDSVNDELIRPKVGRVKKLAEKLFSGTGLNEEKIQIAYDYCTQEIVNISEPTTVYTEEEIEELKRNSSPSDTLKNGYGTGFDINALFASLLGAGGFKVSLAEVEDKSSCTYHVTKLGGFNLSDWAVAAKVNNTWQFYDPGSGFLPCGVLNSANSGSDAIIIEGKFYKDLETAAVGDDFSKVARIANLSIDEYGDLKGKVAIKYSGYEGISLKRAFSGMTDTEMEEFVLEKDWQDRLPRAEISDFSVKNEDSRSKDLILKYSVKIPGYADVAGDRLVFNPSIFQEGESPVFGEEERNSTIGIPFRPHVSDKVTCTIPDGFEFEANAGTDSNNEGQIVSRKSMITKADGQSIVYQRFYTLKVLTIDSRFYPLVKAEFDRMNEADHRPLTLLAKES
ncbi:DUF3857 domain-containing protein [Pelagicoccus mobilis]|uniref:DUF3857 domain-containing protein n=1 Tax=Pelagicoccus mobilis TaxID=415221 RepID=A0A934RX35_9BACT|nr:DUF3857 domain-containing protein [Pelagicoccus mobilis]MBK1878387.1 DUF3857 domain-containing protein [Pelagicoccus mobilis]